MRKILWFLFLLTATKTAVGQPFQLAPPLLKYHSIFFRDKASLEMKFDQPGAEIRYTITGEAPTATDLLYSQPIPITGNRVMIKARAMGPDFLPSETVAVEFIRSGKAIKQIDFTPPHASYTSKTPDPLNDGMGGNPDFKSGSWLGYDTDSVELYIALKKKEKISRVLVSLLQNEGSWIFLPGQILVYAYDPVKQQYKQAGMAVYSSESSSPAQCRAKEIVLDHKVRTTKLRLVLFPLKKIPAWHPGKDKHAWLFIDEIQVY